MAADIVEGAHDTVTAAQDQHPLANHVEGQEVARFGEVGDMTGELPMTAKQQLLFELQKLRIAVGPRRQSAAVPADRNGRIFRFFRGAGPRHAVFLNDHIE